jgi:hypothetical protein
MNLNDHSLNTTSLLRKNICYKFILIQPLSGLFAAASVSIGFLPMAIQIKALRALPAPQIIN